MCVCVCIPNRFRSPCIGTVGNVTMNLEATFSQLGGNPQIQRPTFSNTFATFPLYRRILLTIHVKQNTRCVFGVIAASRIYEHEIHRDFPITI